MKRANAIFKLRYIISPILFFTCCFGIYKNCAAQHSVPVIRATRTDAIITDGKNVKVQWKIDPNLKPDIYYVNVPSKRSKVTLQTNEEKISFITKPDKGYDFVVLLNKQDSCHIRISSVLPPSPLVLDYGNTFPKKIPFKLIGSRIYFTGRLNCKAVNIQFDLGAGTSVVSKLASDRLDLEFSKSTVVSNTSGIHKERTSTSNVLDIDGLCWSGIEVTEVGNMQSYEDMIIGNTLFRDKIIEIDYEKMELTVHDQLPHKAKPYSGQPVYYEQDRPKFKANFMHNDKRYSGWFLFDTGRDGTMLIGEDITGQGNNWKEFKEIMIANGRKVIRLDAVIAKTKIRDIITNAADPAIPQGRPSLFGNQILNHFNVILDNKDGWIYLKPNSRATVPYSDYKSFLQQAGPEK